MVTELIDVSELCTQNTLNKFDTKLPRKVLIYDKNNNDDNNNNSNTLYLKRVARNS